jgi:hypothetical protein
MERNLRLGEVAHLVMAFLHDNREAFPASRAAFEHEARDALKTVTPGRRGVKTLHEILDEYLELKQERKDREDRKACFRFFVTRPMRACLCATRLHVAFLFWAASWTSNRLARSQQSARL